MSVISVADLVNVISQVHLRRVEPVSASRPGVPGTLDNLKF
jgi:hypothetical protein